MKEKYLRIHYRFNRELWYSYTFRRVRRIERWSNQIMGRV